MKIVSPTKATQILQQLIEVGKSGEVTIGLKPDYRVDTTGLASLISLLGLTDETDLEGGGYQVANPLIYVNIRKVDWDGEVVNWDFPDMGQVTATEDFRNQSSLAMTVNVGAGTTVNLRTNFITPDNEIIYVSWGDDDSISTYNTGTEENQTNLTHVYNTAGTYTIFVKGKLVKTTVPGPSKTTDTVTTALHFIKPTVIVDGSMGILGVYEKLTDIIGTIILEGTGTVISNLFVLNKNIANVKGLKLVFPDTCVNGRNITSINAMFGMGCQENPILKANLINDVQLINYNRHAITRINTAFFTSAITEFPYRWFGKNVQTASQTFKNCGNLQFVPSGFFENITQANEMFYCNPDVASPITVSHNLKFPNLTKAAGMFGNRAMSFNDIKTIFESLPKNPNPLRGRTGNTRVDDVSPSDYSITFSFDPNEPNIKQKLVKYFNLNTTAMTTWHKANDTYYGQAIDMNKLWDGGWYPMYFTHYGDSWDYNNHKGWFVNFRNPYNFT